MEIRMSSNAAVDSSAILVSDTDVQELRAQIRGPLILPGDSAYDDARKIWNARIDKRPEYIVRCSGVADIIDAVNFARTHGLLLSVRAGVHNIAGTALCDGGLV